MRADCGASGILRLEQTWRVWNVSVIWITLNRDPDHHFDWISGASGSKQVPKRRFCLGRRSYIAKSLFLHGLTSCGCGCLPSIGPAAETFQPTAGSGARDGSGQKNQSPGLFPTTEHVCPAASVPPVPSAAATDTCAAAPLLTGGTPGQNGR